MNKKLSLLLLLLFSPLVHAQTCESEPYVETVRAIEDDFNPLLPVDTPIATVTITRDETNLIFDFGVDPTSLPAADGWGIRAIIFYASATSPPPQSSGRLMVGNYPYQIIYPGATFDTNGTATFLSRSHHQVIPLSEFGASACGTPIHMSMYVVLSRIENGQEQPQGQGGYLFGANALPMPPGTSQTGVEYWFTYTPCCPNQVTGCTLDKGWYKTHNALAKKPADRIPWLISENTLMCGVTWYSIMQTKQKPTDGWYNLAQQYIAARLNVALGASTPEIVDGALTDGESLLNTTCRAIPANQRTLAQSLTAVLESYNKGELEPASCFAPTP